MEYKSTCYLRRVRYITITMCNHNFLSFDVVSFLYFIWYFPFCRSCFIFIFYTLFIRCYVLAPLRNLTNKSRSYSPVKVCRCGNIYYIFGHVHKFRSSLFGHVNNPQFKFYLKNEKRHKMTKRHKVTVHFKLWHWNDGY